MHGMGKTVNELHAMLKLHEESLPKKDANPALHAIRAGRVQKNQKNKPHKAGRGGKGKGKNKMGYAHNNVSFAPKPKTPPQRSYSGEASASVSKDNLVYFMAVPRDGIFEIDMSCSNTNDSSMYAITNKRAKINLDSSLLWHCRLGHISKKRIEKLQHDGLSILLTLRIVSRQGASYFVTFTDDFSRYGYVYLLKHKHEVFETFKVFQKEVENQLGKTIKSLRSDRGGEYMSQEFLDHLKEHGIIAHRTPPYTPQNNGVQTTLPKSFWDYALETAARILNMVPSKKVDKTPYEIWHGQAPKLSYLRVWGCEAFVKHDTLTKPDKLDPRSYKCIFVGYPKETMGYSFYNPSENKVFVARNAEFFESKLLDLKASGSVEDLELIQEEDTNPSKWLDAMTVGMQSMKDMMVDYEETFSLVADIIAIRILIAIAAYYDYEMWQMDVKTAFSMDSF
ncbi:retrotransposon protein, putative, ty1-copia subclass [Tanacetum coccineum]